MTYSLHDRLPLLEVAHDTIVSKMGACTLALELRKQEIFTLSEDELAVLHQAWVKAIQTLPAGTILHVQDWFVRATFNGVGGRNGQEHGGKEGANEGEQPAGHFLADASNRHFHERSTLQHRCYLFLTKVPDHWKLPDSSGSTLLRKQLIPGETLDPIARQEFLDTANQFVRILTDSKLIELRQLGTEELLSSPQHAGIIEQYLVPGQDGAGDHFAIGDIQFKPDIRIGDYYGKLYTLADAEHLPPQCSASTEHRPYSTERTRFPLGFASPLGLLLDCDHIYNQYIIIPDQSATKEKLEGKQRRHRSLSAHSRSNARTHEAANEFLNEAITEQRTIVRAHFNVFAWADSAAGIKDIRNKLGSAIAHMGATPHCETNGAPAIWWAGIPGNAGDLPVNETFLAFTEQAVCFLIPETNYRSSDSPFGIRLGDRLTGYPLHVDLSDEPLSKGWINNLNKLVIGGSGSGKSYKINHLVHSYYNQGAHIVVVDIGGSYQGLCELVGGYYFAYSEKEPIRFNPFWLDGDEKPGIEKKESIKTLLLALWKQDDEAFLRFEYVALSNALQLYYEHLAANPTIFPCFNSFFEYLQDQFITVLENDRVKEKDFDIHNFLYVLRPFYRGGEYDYLLNADANLDLQAQRFIVFELDNIKDHPILFPVVTIIIMELFVNKMRKLPGVRKLIVIEEAWKVIMKQGMSEYVKYLFKTVRKFFGEAIVATQEVDDIVSSPVVKQAIINNTDCKILLDLSKFQNQFDQLQELLGLTEKDKALVLSLNRANEPGRKYKEVFIGMKNGYSKVYRNEVSPEEHFVYTTEPSEKVLVRAYTQKYGSIRRGIAALVAELRTGAVRGAMVIVLLTGSLLLPNSRAHAQLFIAEIIQEGIKKVIVATDLEIQRLQTQTIVLQDAQRTIENAMQQLQLSSIADWVQRQKDLYGEYYQELWTVKSALALYQRVKDMIHKQVRLVSDYKRAYTAMRQDPHFSGAELVRLSGVYDGILGESINTIKALMLVINSFTTQMDDGNRLLLIDRADEDIDRQYSSLQRFTQENILLSIQRSKDQQDIQFIKSLYGIQ